jgi:hypothetical protein
MHPQVGLDLDAASTFDTCVVANPAAPGRKWGDMSTWRDEKANPWAAKEQQRLAHTINHAAEMGDDR